MMKIYQKKNASLEDETVLVQLERRHTVKEITDDVHMEDRKTARTKSLGILAGSQSSTDVEAVSADKKSGFKRRPTVITESELASSTLYKDRKAKINSDDESIDDPKSSMPPENHEDLEPRAMQDPSMKPIPVSIQRPRKASSCCWYFAIILVIFIACLAVMAGVGAIVYMEYFATYNKVDIPDALEKNDNPSDSKGIFQHPPHKQENLHLNEPEIPENILKDLVKNSVILATDTVSTRNVPVIISHPNRDILDDKGLSDSSDIKTKVLEEIKSSFVSESQDIELTEHSNSDNFRDTHGRIRLFKVPVIDKFLGTKDNVKDQDSLDLKINYQNKNYDMDKVPDEHTDGATEKIIEQAISIDEKSNLIAEVSDSRNGTLSAFKTFHIGKMSTLHDSSLRDEQANKDIPSQNLAKENKIGHLVNPLPNDDSHENINISFGNSIDDNSLDHSFDSLEDNSFNNLKDNSLNHAEHSIGHDPTDTSLDHAKHSIDRDPTDTSLAHAKHSIDRDPTDTSLDHAKHSIDHDPKDTSLDHAEHTVDLNLEEISSLNHTEHSNGRNLEDHADHFNDNSIVDDSLDHTEHIIDHSLEDISLDDAEHSIGHNVEEISLDHVGQSTDHSSEGNLLDHTELFFPHNNKSLFNHNKDSNESDTDDSGSEEHSMTDDLNKNDDPDKLVLIRPVVESKPVPVNVEFLKRMGIDIKNPNNRQPMTTEDMDIKFSLAEALKFLKSLDTDNKLPVSREKTVTTKTNNLAKRKAVKLPLTAERKEYLNILRKKLYEQNL